MGQTQSGKGSIVRITYDKRRWCLYTIVNKSSMSVIIKDFNNNHYGNLITKDDEWVLKGEDVPHTVEIIDTTCLTGNKDIDTLIISELDMTIIRILCLTNVYNYSLCRSRKLWVKILPDIKRDHDLRLGVCLHLKGRSPLDMINNAVLEGAVELSQYLCYKYKIVPIIKVVDEAVAEGHLNMIKWLVANKIAMPSNTCIHDAAVNSHLEMVKWLHSNVNVMISSNTCNDVAAKGNIAML